MSENSEASVVKLGNFNFNKARIMGGGGVSPLTVHSVIIRELMKLRRLIIHIVLN